MQNFDHNIGFWEKRQFFRRKLVEICLLFCSRIFLITKVAQNLVLLFYHSKSCAIVSTTYGLGHVHFWPFFLKRIWSPCWKDSIHQIFVILQWRDEGKILLISATALGKVSQCRLFKKKKNDLFWDNILKYFCHIPNIFWRRTIFW
jgi:hypothetical protein